MSLPQNVAGNAHYATYISATGAVTLWGLHLSELAVMVSSLAAVCGAVIQVLNYLDHRAKRRRQETEHHGETH